MNKIIICTAVQLKNKLFSMRFLVAGAFILMFSRLAIGDLGKFCVQSHTTVTQWVFPFIFSSPYYTLLFYMVFVYMLMDIPALEYDQTFYILRAQRTKWILSQIVYVFCISCLFVFEIAVASFLWIFPYLGYSDEWGKILTTLARSKNGGMLAVDHAVIDNGNPMTVLLQSISVNVLICLLIGLIILFFNLRFRTNTGSAIAVIFVVFQYFLDSEFLYNSSLLYFSPVSWSNVALYYKAGSQAFENYVWSALIAISVILITLSITVFRKYSIVIVRNENS